MKTPKRDYKLPPSLTRTDISDYFEPEYHAQEARWKRKNRVAQLKATIARLRAENKMLFEERNKYIDFYYRALGDLVEVRTQEVLATKKQNRKENQQ